MGDRGVGKTSFKDTWISSASRRVKEIESINPKEEIVAELDVQEFPHDFNECFDEFL